MPSAARTHRKVKKKTEPWSWRCRLRPRASWALMEQEDQLMPPDPSFDELIRRVGAGDQQAAAQLVRDFEPVVRRVLRARLRDARARREFDSMDICQSVLAIFFVRVVTDTIRSRKQLKRLLIRGAWVRIPPPSFETTYVNSVSPMDVRPVPSPSRVAARGNACRCCEPSLIRPASTLRRCRTWRDPI